MTNWLEDVNKLVDEWDKRNEEGKVLDPAPAWWSWAFEVWHKLRLGWKQWFWRRENLKLRKLQYRCQHREHWVKADLLEGQCGDDGPAVEWCERCGAVRIVYFGVKKQIGRQAGSFTSWTRPVPTWQKW